MGITIQEIFQAHTAKLVETTPLSRDMLRAAYRIRDCRTPDMGTHIRRCPLGHVSYTENNSCKHRFCQQCNALERDRWMTRWSARLLPCPHHHVVFTVPHELLDLWRYNKQLFARFLFEAACGALRQLLADPKYCGGRVGLLAALHTWSQTLAAHVHLHVLVTAGGLDPVTGRWLPTKRECLLPRKVLMIIFRGKFRALVLAALAKGALNLPPGYANNHWHNLINRLGRVAWNVKVFGRYKDGRGVALYLAKYLRGGPIGNGRLLSFDDQSVGFRYRVPAYEVDEGSRQGTMELDTCEFMRRLLEHVPERGMQTVRGYGLYSGNQHSRLAEAFVALGSKPPEKDQGKLEVGQWLAKLGRDPSCLNCPICGRQLETIRLPRPRKARAARSPPPVSTTVVPVLSVVA